MNPPRTAAPEHRVNRVRRFAVGHPRGTVLPCVVHDRRMRKSGLDLEFYERKVEVEIIEFAFSRALVKVLRRDTGEILRVDIGWFSTEPR